MKGSIIAGLLLILLVLLVICNAFYVHHVTNRLTSMAESLPEHLSSDVSNQIAQNVAKMQAYQKKHEILLGISVSYTSPDRIAELSATLMTCARLHADYDYTATRNLLIDAIRDAARLEKLEIKNIF